MKLVKRLAPVFALPLVAFFLFASAAATTTGTTPSQRAEAERRGDGRCPRRLRHRQRRPGERPGHKFIVWNVLTGKTTKVSGRITDQADGTSTGHGVRELAIAGQRVAWIINQGGNTESDDYLYTSLLAKPAEKKLASASRTAT